MKKLLGHRSHYWPKQSQMKEGSSSQYNSLPLARTTHQTSTNFRRQSSVCRRLWSRQSWSSKPIAFFAHLDALNVRHVIESAVEWDTESLGLSHEWLWPLRLAIWMMTPFSQFRREWRTSSEMILVLLSVWSVSAVRFCRNTNEFQGFLMNFALKPQMTVSVW